MAEMLRRPVPEFVVVQLAIAACAVFPAAAFNAARAISRLVLCAVNARSHECKVARTIVSPVSVDMVNELGTEKLATQQALHNGTVLEDVSVRPATGMVGGTNQHVPVGVEPLPTPAGVMALQEAVMLPLLNTAGTTRLGGGQRFLPTTTSAQHMTIIHRERVCVNEAYSG